MVYFSLIFIVLILLILIIKDVIVMGEIWLKFLEIRKWVKFYIGYDFFL